MKIKSLLLSLFALFSAVSISYGQAETDPKYLKGAVPEVNGKVVFNKAIESSPKLDDGQLFEKVNTWADKTYNLNDGNTTNRVLLSDPEKKQIACAGEEAVVFGRKLLSLDMGTMSYQLILKIEDGFCNATIRSINYGYSNGKEIERLLAEDMITDKVAVNKKGDKLNNYYGKFRKTTVDSIQAIFNSLDNYINGKGENQKVQYIYIDKETGKEIPQATAETPSVIAAVPLQPAIPIQVNESAAALPGYKNISPDNIPGNYVKLLDEWTLVTSGKGDNVNVMTASWGGLGTFWGKPVTFLFLNPTRYSIKTMDEGETYTISFYSPAYKDVLQYCGTKSGRDTDKIKGSGLTPVKTPSGATAFSEAWMIIECRKMIAQPLSEASIKIDRSEVKDSWTKDGLHKMYMGEILNVWIK